jgi:hypothetical protein
MAYVTEKYPERVRSSGRALQDLELFFLKMRKVYSSCKEGSSSLPTLTLKVLGFSKAEDCQENLGAP